MKNNCEDVGLTLLPANKIKRSRSELFKAIADSVRSSCKGNMTKEESRRLAANFIGFCQKLIDIQIRIEREDELKRQQ